LAPVEQRLPLVVEQLVFACRQARPVKAKDLVVRTERVLDRILGIWRTRRPQFRAFWKAHQDRILAVEREPLRAGAA
jgi:hypothetical protein